MGGKKRGKTKGKQQHELIDYVVQLGINHKIAEKVLWRFASPFCFNDRRALVNLTADVLGADFHNFCLEETARSCEDLPSQAVRRRCRLTSA